MDSGFWSKVQLTHCNKILPNLPGLLGIFTNSSAKFRTVKKNKRFKKDNLTFITSIILSIANINS